MKDLILDFETLGNGKESDSFLIIDVAYLFFDMKDNNTFDELTSRAKKFKFSLQEQMNEFKWVAEKDTLEWWKSQDKEAMKAIKPSSEDVSVREFVAEFKKDCAKHMPKRAWARGTDFDFPIMKRIFRQVGEDVNEAFKFWTVRDMRTFMDVMGNFELKDLGAIPPTGENVGFVKHDSRHDIAMDVLRIQYFMKGE